MTEPSGLPHEADHDFSADPRETWRDRDESDTTWDLSVLGITAGSRVRIERRDGTAVEGLVRQRDDGHGWWQPTVGPGDVVYVDPSGEAVPVAEIVSISALPDDDYTHDSDREGTED